MEVNIKVNDRYTTGIHFWNTCVFTLAGRAWTFEPTGKGRKGSEVVQKKGSDKLEKGLLENLCYNRHFSPKTGLKMAQHTF